MSVFWLISLGAGLLIGSPFYLGALLRRRRIELEMTMPRYQHEPTIAHLFSEIGELRPYFGDVLPLSSFFHSELMTCVLCGREEQGEPDQVSQWRMLDIDGQHFYACPAEFPPDETGTVKDFKAAYELLLAACILALIPDPPQHLVDLLATLHEQAPWRNNANTA